jgi:hypothetical protein
MGDHARSSKRQMPSPLKAAYTSWGFPGHFVGLRGADMSTLLSYKGYLHGGASDYASPSLPITSRVRFVLQRIALVRLTAARMQPSR